MLLAAATPGVPFVPGELATPVPPIQVHSLVVVGLGFGLEDVLVVLVFEDVPAEDIPIELPFEQPQRTTTPIPASRQTHALIHTQVMLKPVDFLHFVAVTP